MPERSSTPDNVVPLFPAVPPEFTPDDILTDAVHRLHPQMLAVARGRVGSEDDAKDVVQEAMIRCWNRLHAMAPAAIAAESASIDATLFRLVNDVAMERHRKHARQRSIARRVGGSVTSYVVTHISSPFISGVRRWMQPERELERSEIDPLLSSAVARLPQKMREAWELVAADDLSYVEASAVLQLGESAVRQRVCRAQAMLRDGFKRAGITRSLMVEGSSSAVAKLPAPSTTVEAP